MIHNFKKKLQQANYGRELFKKLFTISELNTDDSFVLILTNNKKYIHYSIKYLSDFIKLYKRNVFVLLSSIEYVEDFSKAGANTKICTKDELVNLASYLNVFLRKDQIDFRIIILSEKDEYGFPINELMNSGEFSLEEYVAISLYQLKNIRKEDKCENA